jgi:divalent metal cation (Fe/Co/Zn/Cd) transporter
MSEAVALDQRASLARRGQTLEWVTVIWNCLECLIALLAGWWAGSIALVGFGVDSLIEVASAGALIWRLRHDHRVAERANRDRTALRIVGWCFLALAAYVGWNSVEMLIRREAPAESWTGIALALLSVAVMPLLARAKRRVATGLNSAALAADARQTDLCAYLSVILLAGLAGNALFGWWWCDPAAALFMVPIIAREGVNALRGQACSDCGSCAH